MSAHIVETVVPCERQFARGVRIAHENARERFSRLAADEPALHDGRHLVTPRHGHCIARDVDEHDILVHASERLNQLILTIGHVHVLAVVALGILIVALVQAAEDDDIIGTLSLGDCLGDEFAGRAVFGQRLLGHNAIVFTCGVTHIAAGIIYLDAGTSQACLQSFKRQNLMLHFERTAAAADGHHLDGVLADNQHTLGVVQVHGQDIALVLQQHDTVLSHLHGRVIVRLTAQEALSTLIAHGRAEEQT